MKKLIVLAALLTLLCAAPALANPRVIAQGARVSWIETATGNASGNATIVISPAMAPIAHWALLAGKPLYKLITIPGTGDVTPTAWIGDIKDSLGRTVLPITTRSTTDTEEIQGYENAAGNWEPLMSPWTVTLTGIGAGNQVTVYLIFW